MCRITGFVDYVGHNSTRDILIGMRDSLAAGGPDSAGIFMEDSVGLAHRRLSIIDLSESGFQPMIVGKWVITYNGEVYNYQEIKNELIAAGCTFSTKTDTEVIVRAIELWGKNAVRKFRGMFAFALWNTEEKKLLLCRDRLGVKPLYWYYKDGLFLFASEIKAFHKHPSFDKSIDLDGLPHYFQKGYFHPHQCIYKHVKQVPGGTFLEIDISQNIHTSVYWDVRDVYKNAIIDQRPEEKIIKELESKLLESFRLRMVSDVEVGVFLSGGIDSTLVAALLQHDNPKSLRTFTIGFEDQRFNEADAAAEISKRLGTNHASLICTDEEVRNVLPYIAEMYDEPFGDSSAIPTFLVSKLASQHVKVALSGDGGDELFGGYSKYRFAKHAKLLLGIPYPFRALMNKASYYVSPANVEWVSQKIKMTSYSQMSSKYLKFQETLLAIDQEDFFDKSSSYLSDACIRKFMGETRLHVKNDNIKNRGDLFNFLGLKDMLSYLPGDILAKVDRASMHVALESREPFLDPELIAFAFTIPDHLKISKEGEGKYLLRKVLGKYITPELMNRPKQGFTVPIADWLHGFLKVEIIDMAHDSEFFDKFKLDKNYFSVILKSFFEGEHKYNSYFIWFVYCLYKWFKKWI